jgi:hypothetical protein
VSLLETTLPLRFSNIQLRIARRRNWAGNTMGRHWGLKFGEFREPPRWKKHETLFFAKEFMSAAGEKCRQNQARKSAK